MKKLKAWAIVTKDKFKIPICLAPHTQPLFYNTWAIFTKKKDADKVAKKSRQLFKDVDPRLKVVPIVISL